MYSILTSDWRCSVMSSCVATQPPPAIGRWRILKVRPFISSTMLSFASLETATLVRQCRYSSRVMAGKLPASKRRSTISISDMPGLTRSGANIVHLDEAIVADDQAVVGIEEAKPLRHVVDRGVELEVPDAQRLFLRLAEFVLLLQPGIELFTLGDVLVGRHPAAAGHG